MVDRKTEEEKEINKASYKISKKETKKVVADAKPKAYRHIYEELNTKGGEKTLSRLAKAREKRTREIYQMRCIKDEDCGRVEVDDTLDLAVEQREKGDEGRRGGDD